MSPRVEKVQAFSGHLQMTAKTLAGRRHRAICPPDPAHPGHRAVREQAQLLLASVRGDRISVRHTGAELATNLR